ncbi:hypothetical protein BDL97_01G112600 [Sphagnum fallax]|nr:hypothetical protein BDL97_01G112600 [Sphagnum fallax]
MDIASPRTRVGKYEIGKLLGEGTFAKVKLAKNKETGESVAIKVIDKEKILKHKMLEQIKREISTMKLVKHPNIVQLLEVMASKTKIYIVMEYATGGELFDKIVHQGRLKEEQSRKYFQQLIDAVDYCHSRGVYHRDLKPENLLLDAAGNLKISDFGLSALPQQLREDGLLHTTCGTPNYVAPEVIVDKGYHGATVDLWSCGVILFVLMAGYLPFDDPNLLNLYRKIYRAEFSCPSWFSSGARKLLSKLLDPNAKTRYTAAQIYKNDWFRKSYKPAQHTEKLNVTLEDINAVFNDSSEFLVMEKKEMKPASMNAFELISLSSGLDLSGLFEQPQDVEKGETRFTSKKSAKEIVNTIEEAARPLGFNVQIQNHKLKLQGDKQGRKGQLSVSTQVFEVAPSLFMVELSKNNGDTIEYNHFCKNLSKGLKDIVWKAEEADTASGN